MAKKLTRDEQIKHSEKYIEFLTTRLGSSNYKAVASKEEYAETKAKLDKERLILRMLK